MQCWWLLSCSLQWRGVMNSPGVTLQAVLLSLLLLLCSVSAGTGAPQLECHCSACEGEVRPGHIWQTCHTGGACYTEVSGDSTVLRGCVSREKAAAKCASVGVVCCLGNKCNGKPVGSWSHQRKLLADVTPESMSMMSNERSVAIITASVCLVILTVAVSLLVAVIICCLYFYRGNHRSHSQADEEMERAIIGRNCCSAIIPHGETISSLLRASHSPTDSAPSPSLSLLVQRAIVKNTSVERLLESGQFCDWSLGRWRGESVMVKSYPPKHEKIWFAETEIHQVPHMHHPHILTFIGADYLHSHGQLKHYLITEYQDRGCLSDYLHEATLDVGAVVVLAQSAASGLAHLHMEVTGEKPSIVHRNIASRSFYVKRDGSCCLGELSLALKEHANFMDEVQDKPFGHAPYQSPEVLESWASREPLVFDVWKKADVYGLGLVMWEIARRCLIEGCVDSAELPYSAFSSSDHTSLEEMRQLVSHKKLRPSLAEHWSRDEIMKSCVQIMTECWHDQPSSRPSAMSAKNSLDKLLPSIKLSKSSK